MRISPSSEQLALLRPNERRAFGVADFINRHPLMKRAGHFYLRTFGAAWVAACTRHLRHVDGLEHVQALAGSDRGVIVASNHRSFFDLYVMSSVLLHNAPWVERMFFPVRSEFFYESSAGMAVNAVMSAFAMYPPVLRRPEARAFNEFAVDALVEELRRPGSVVGIHPEGTRGRGPNPYELLPAQPGIGQLVHRTRAQILPVFVLGLGNDFVRQVKGNFDGAGEPITLVFGKPPDLGPLLDEPPRLRTYLKIAERLRQELVAVGGQERRFRQKLGLKPLGPESSAVDPAA